MMSHRASHNGECSISSISSNIDNRNTLLHKSRHMDNSNNNTIINKHGHHNNAISRRYHHISPTNHIPSFLILLLLILQGASPKRTKI